MYLPSFNVPSKIWNAPAIITTVNVIAIPVSGYFATMLVKTAVMITVMGPVGSEINVEEPPNNEAKSPTIIAPQRPASAPAPDATPNTSARGSDIMAVVTPPKRSLLN